MPVFDAQYAAQYDRLYATKDYRAECDLIEAAIARFSAAPPRSLLDVGCGTGQHSIELARRGLRVTGVDLSESMLGHAEKNAADLAEERRPKWVHGDARNFEAGGRHDIAIMMFAVVGYLTGNDDVLTGLRNIRRHLAPGALFICDFWYGPSVLSDRPTDRVRVLPTATGKVLRTTQTKLDVVRHTAEVSFQLWNIEGDRVIDETHEIHRMRYFFPQEFALLLSQSGFEMQNISAFPTLDNPLTDATWNAFVVAKSI
jgi:SAM-dependent methyltransferase